MKKYIKHIVVIVIFFVTGNAFSANFSCVEKRHSCAIVKAKKIKKQPCHQKVEIKNKSETKKQLTCACVKVTILKAEKKLNSNVEPLKLTKSFFAITSLGSINIWNSSNLNTYLNYQVGYGWGSPKQKYSISILKQIFQI